MHWDERCSMLSVKETYIAIAVSHIFYDRYYVRRQLNLAKRVKHRVFSQHFLVGEIMREQPWKAAPATILAYYVVESIYT